LFRVVHRLLQHSFVYAVATVLNRAVNIILLPVYTRCLSKVDYGALEILFITSTLLVLVLQLGMGSALFRNLLYKTGGRRKEIISTAHYFVIGIGFCILSIGFIFSDRLAVVLFDSANLAGALRILFLCDFFLIYQAIPMAVLRIDQKSVKFAIIAGANFITAISLNLFFIYHLDAGIEGIMLANTIAAALFALVYTIVLRQDLGFCFSRSELKDMFGFGAPLVPAALGDMILMLSDRYFLKFYCGLETVASYGVVVRISTILVLAVNSFQMAWPAMFFSIAKEKDAPKIFAKLFDYYLAMLLFITLALSLFSTELVGLLATKNLAEGAHVLPLLLLSFVFYGIYYYGSIGIQIYKKTYFVAIVMWSAVVVNVLLNIFLIPRYNMLGTSLARLSSYAFLGTALTAIASKYYYVPYHYKILLETIGLSVLCYFLSTLIHPGVYMHFAMKAILLIGFLFFLLKIVPQEGSGIKGIKKMVVAFSGFFGNENDDEHA
jgi:O-antigen/teichoic acid export membrane protein